MSLWRGGWNQIQIGIFRYRKEHCNCECFMSIHLRKCHCHQKTKITYFKRRKEKNNCCKGCTEKFPCLVWCFSVWLLLSLILTISFLMSLNLLRLLIFNSLALQIVSKTSILVLVDSSSGSRNFNLSEWVLATSSIFLTRHFHFWADSWIEFN